MNRTYIYQRIYDAWTEFVLIVINMQYTDWKLIDFVVLSGAVKWKPRQFCGIIFRDVFFCIDDLFGYIYV